MLLIGVGVIALLIGLYFFVSKKSTEYESSQSKSYDSLISLTADQISKISWTVTGGDTLSFTRTDGTWTDDADSSVSLDQDKVNTVASGVTGISIDQTMTDVTDLSKYGLDAPTFTLTVTDTSGNETAVTLGAQNTTASSVYAYKGTDTSTVYSCASTITSTLKKTISDLTATSSADSGDTSSAS